MTEYKVSRTNLQKSIHGSVRHQGLPVSGIKIQLYSQHEAESMSGQSPTDSPVAEEISGPRGEYEFYAQPGTYSIQVIPRSDSRLLKQSIFNIQVDRSGTNYDISLIPGNILSGVVRTKSGDPVRSGEVFALGIEPTPYWSTSKIDRNGRYSLVLPRGKFHLGSRSSSSGIFGNEEKNGLSAQAGHGSYYLSKQIQSVDLYRDQSFDIELPEMVRYRGELVDPLGNAVAGARLLFTPKDVEESPVLSELDFSSSCMTDAAGKFEILLESGIFDLDVVPRQDSKQFGFSEADIKIDSPQQRKFTLEEGHKLSGRVLFKDEPLPDCLVRIHSHENDREFIAESNQNGEFAASIPPGVYTILVSSGAKKGKINQNEDSSESAEIAPWTKEIVVGGDTHVGIKLKSGIDLTGCIKDDSGRPKAGIRVSVFSSTKNNQEGLNEENLGRSMAHTNTDTQGNFSFSLIKGKYWLVVHRDFESARQVDISDQQRHVDISWHGWCQVRFKVEGEEGEGIPRCKVSYEPYKVNGESPSNNNSSEPVEHPSGYVITDRDGICKLTIPSGIYTFRFGPPLAGSYAEKEIRQLSVIADSNRKIALARKN